MIDRACISLNARCNLNCTYCHFAAKKNNNNTKANEFSCEEVKTFCQNLYSYIKEHNIPLFKLGIVGAGEPLLSFPQLKTIVEFFDKGDLKNNIRMYTISNGTLLNDEIINYFFNHKDIIELNVSLDGDESINKKQRGSFPNLNKYLVEFGVMPRINAVVTKEVINNEDRILSFFVKNGFDRINFSKVFATDDPSINVSNQEYSAFLLRAKELGIASRQNIIENKYDCAKYGRLCGVGKNNIYIAKTGVYPCGRFMDIKTYQIGSWDDSFDLLEKSLSRFAPCPRGECYFEYNKVGK